MIENIAIILTVQHLTRKMLQWQKKRKGKCDNEEKYNISPTFSNTKTVENWTILTLYNTAKGSTPDLYWFTVAHFDLRWVTEYVIYSFICSIKSWSPKTIFHVCKTRPQIIHGHVGIHFLRQCLLKWVNRPPSFVLHMTNYYHCGSN